MTNIEKLMKESISQAERYDEEQEAINAAKTATDLLEEFVEYAKDRGDNCWWLDGFLSDFINKKNGISTAYESV